MLFDKLNPYQRYDLIKLAAKINEHEFETSQLLEVKIAPQL